MPPNKKSESPKTEHEQLAELLEMTQGAIGKDRVHFGSNPDLHMDTISTGVMELDRIIGGGWRMGRIGMVVGEASMGKTLITQWTIAAFQKRGMTCGFMDPERTFDAEWFTKTGVDVSKLIVVRPENTEQAFDIACMWAKSKMDLIVLDSIAALVPKMRAEHKLEDREVMGLAANKLGEGIRQLNNVNLHSFVLFTNQLRSKLGVVYGSPDTIPGGRAQKFVATYILNVRRAGWIPDSKDRQGYKLKIITDKNKLAPPFQEAEIPFLFTGVIDTIGGLIELIKEFDVIPHKAGFFKWEEKTYHGADAFKTFLASDEESRIRLQAEVEKTMKAEPAFGEETKFDETEYNPSEVENEEF